MLINRLRKTLQEVKQVWLADDASAGGKLVQLQQYFTTLITEGRNTVIMSTKEIVAYFKEHKWARKG